MWPYQLPVYQSFCTSDFAALGWRRLGFVLWFLICYYSVLVFLFEHSKSATLEKALMLNLNFPGILQTDMEQWMTILPQESIETCAKDLD